jgi:hypothetical protein
MKDKHILLVEKEIKKDEVIAAASRLVKDHDDTDNRGMTEVSYRLLMEVDKCLFELQQIENQIADHNIQNL